MRIARSARGSIRIWSLLSTLFLPFPAHLHAAEIVGEVRVESGAPVAGVQVTAKHGTLGKATTVFSRTDGAYHIANIEPGKYSVRARRVGFMDVSVAPLTLDDKLRHDITMDPIDSQLAIHQLPASDWFARVQFSKPSLRGEFAIQCAMCHQQGSAMTRIPRPVDQWRQIFDRMSEMGALITDELREEAPAALNAAYRVDFQNEEPVKPLPVSEEVAASVITEWEVGATTSMLHDIVVGGDKRIYAADWIMDKMYRLDPETSERKGWDVPRGDVKAGGVLRSFAKRGQQYFHHIPHIAPHSLQSGPAGDVWLTLSLGKGLAQFDPRSETFTLHNQPSAGMYPHTLRFDSEGQIWYTLAMSNHVARFNPESGEFKLYRLPTRTMGQQFFVSTLRFWIWLADFFDASGISVSDPELVPIAYGIDVAPDGGIWFSQFNHRRIGRVDPQTGDIRVIDTPFYGPRRLRFDSKGILWIPAYAEGKIYRFDPADESFKAYDMPTGKGDMPYALAVDKQSDNVWICGTNSDSIIRFEPDRSRFTVFPIPTRVTFTREIEIDEEGNVWTSNSNLPGWQIEGGKPSVVRLSFPKKPVLAAHQKPH